MINTEISKTSAAPAGFALVMESDVDLRATICSALLLEGHRVESVADCAGVLSWRKSLGPLPDDLLLALGAGEFDEDAVLSRASVIVLLTIQNGLTFPARARIVQKPFAIEKLMALVASDMKAAAQNPV